MLTDTALKLCKIAADLELRYNPDSHLAKMVLALCAERTELTTLWLEAKKEALGAMVERNTLAHTNIDLIKELAELRQERDKLYSYLDTYSASLRELCNLYINWSRMPNERTMATLRDFGFVPPETQAKAAYSKTRPQNADGLEDRCEVRISTGRCTLKAGHTTPHYGPHDEVWD
jgi:hypothetical protein